MPVDVKKPLRMMNRTNYFSPDSSRSHVAFSSPASYQSRRVKCEGYETRLYWQFRYCEEHDGQTFFVTLTYNDKSIPKYFGENCFDYEDLRYLLTGGFRKILLRQYGTVFKYFIGAELGDGKGKRGMHNNPHYHVLFFLEPDPDSKFPYVAISPQEFLHLVRYYWQGFDQDTDGYRDYRTAKYGIVHEGKFGVKVTDFRACVYCAKYVCKDAGLVKRECEIEKRLTQKFRQEFMYSEEFHAFFADSVLNELYNTPLNPKKTEWSFSRLRLLEEITGKSLRAFFDFSRSGDWTIFTEHVRSYEDLFDSGDLFGVVHSVVFDIVKDKHLWKQYWESFDSFISDKVRVGINEYRNRYCNKCRISHGVGDYALQFIDDKLNPLIQFPSKKGFKYRPPCLYYYRKLFTDVLIDDNGSPLRVLNEDGMRYKVARLEHQINRLSEKAQINLDLVLLDPSLFDMMRQSMVNTCVTMSHDALKRICSRYNPHELTNIMKRYAEYKLIYEDRFFPFDKTGKGIDYFPTINLYFDYIRFLVPSVYSVSRSDMRLSNFIQDGAPNYLSYSQHPYFMQYLSLFGVLDLCADYFFVQSDNKSQKDAEEFARIKRFHDKRNLKEFYSAFK